MIEQSDEFLFFKTFLRNSGDWQEYLESLDLKDYPLEEFPIFIWEGDYQTHEDIFRKLMATKKETINDKEALLTYDDYRDLIYLFKHLYQNDEIKLEPLYKDLYWLDYETPTCTFEQLLNLAYRLESYFGFIPIDTSCFSDESSDAAVYFSIFQDWKDDYELKHYTFKDFLLSCSGEYWWESISIEKFDVFWNNKSFERFQEYIKIDEGDLNQDSSLYRNSKKIALMENFLENYQREIIQIAEKQYAETILSRNKWLRILELLWSFSTPKPLVYSIWLRILELLWRFSTPKPLVYSIDKEFIQWQGHYFRSPMEMNIAQALDEKEVLFFPCAGCRVKGDTKMQTRELDFLVFYKGNWGILECDGKQYHLDPEKDKKRDQMFKDNGIKFIKRYGYKDCQFKFKNTVDCFLRDMEDFYKNI